MGDTILKHAIAGVETESQDLRVAHSERPPCVTNGMFHVCGPGEFRTSSGPVKGDGKQRHVPISAVGLSIPSTVFFSHFSSSSPVRAPLRPRLARLGLMLWSLRAAAAAAGISTLQGG